VNCNWWIRIGADGLRQLQIATRDLLLATATATQLELESPERGTWLQVLEVVGSRGVDRAF
jgi:hypothetical protein